MEGGHLKIESPRGYRHEESSLADASQILRGL